MGGLVYTVERVVPARREGEGAVLPVAEWRGRVEELGDEALKSLWEETVGYARWEIGQYGCWRGLEEPSMPGGYSAEAVTQMAFEKLLAPAEASSQKLYRAEEIRLELRKLVKRRVWKLHEWSERKRVVSEWNVMPPRPNGELVSVFDHMPGGIPAPDVEAMAAEKRRLLEDFKREFAGSLGTAEELRRLFLCAWDGETRWQAAEKLGVKVERVTNLHKELRRRLGDFGVRARGAMAEMLRDVCGAGEETSEEPGHIEKAE